VTATTERKSLEPFLKDDVQYYPHQVPAIRDMARMNSFLLADDMGLGKSLQALTVFCIDVKRGIAETMLVVCPVTLRENWVDEIEKFTRIPYTLLGEVANPNKRGEMKKLTPAKRQAQLVEFTQQTGPRILICNYEQLVNPVHSATLRKFQFSAALYDEAHYIKNHKAKRTDAALAIRSKRSFMLTGTPMLNQVNELWTLLHRIDPRAFPKYWTFVNRYCVFGGFENRQIIGVKNEAELKKILGKIMIRRMKNDVLARDKPTYIQHKVGLSDTQRKLYDQIENELYLTDGNGVEYDVENDLTKFLRLKQVCNTPYSIDPSLPDDSLKLDRVIEVCEEIASANDKFVLFTQFRGTMAATANRIYKAKLGPLHLLNGDVPTGERVPIVKQWGSERGASILLCMTQVAGVGLNMVKANQGGFIDKLFVPGLNKQAVDRMDRIGQDKPVLIHEFITKGTVESRIEAILRSKEMLNADIVEGSVGMRKLIELLKQNMQED
jgi:SNF2 family DNA or RNA helicase